MKRFSKILFSFLFLCTASLSKAQDYYEQQWKKFEEKILNGDYKSNLPLVQEIQNRAMKENNMIQILRSLRTEYLLLLDTHEDESNNSISQFFSKIIKVEKQLKGNDLLLLKVLKPHFISEYYDNSSWEINSRTNINNPDINAIETWSKLDFKNYMFGLYNELYSKEEALKKISLSPYKDIFSSNEDMEYFPTLWDWYALKKIEFLANDELFTKNELKENQPKINTIYDALIAKNEGNVKLYMMKEKVDNNCDFEDCKDRVEQLQNILNSPTEGDYKVIIAESLISEFINKQENVKALDFIKQTRAKYPTSKFLKNLEIREQSILNPTLTLSYEKETQPNIPIHLSVSHKNINNLKINIYEIKDEKSYIDYITNSYNYDFKNLKKNLVRTEQYAIQDFKDYKKHRTSLEIKALPPGLYAAEYEVNGIKLEEMENVDFFFIVSDFKILSVNKKKQEVFRIVNNENGEKLSSKNFVVHEWLNDGSLKKSSFKTDENGFFTFPQDAKNTYYKRYLVQQENTNNYQWIQFYPNNTEVNLKSDNSTKYLQQVFTDRAIYRPGQLVYFKVIVTQLSNNKQSVVAKSKQTIKLFDANNQEISSQDFTTNEFGSYHGSFTLPQGKLNGNFYLKTDGVSPIYKPIRVEEYKRPKFEITFDPVKDDYKYGQIVNLKGKAAMFSGVALSNTTIHYSIKKQDIRWIYFPFYDSDYSGNTILGEAKTNEKGEFTIQLNLEKDETKEGIQIDNYQVSASATDINGETQTANTNLKVASVSHYIKQENIENVFTNEDVKVEVDLMNYNEQNLQKEYQVKLSKKENPNRIFRDNFKSVIQDAPQLSYEEFVKKFPHDYYKKSELDNKKKTILQKTQNSSAKSLDLGKLKAGNYELELYNIEGKDTIKSIQNFSVWNPKSSKDNPVKLLEVLHPKKEYERGEKVAVKIYSAIPDALVSIFIQDGSGSTINDEKKLKNGFLNYEVTLPKDERVSELNLQFQIVAFNNVETKGIGLKIKNNIQPLKVETSTFRNLLDTNVKEKWSLKIEGNGKEKVNAEVLANMYDLSLDQFLKNAYSWQNISNKYSVIQGYQVSQNLSTDYFERRIPYLSGFGIDIPEFSWFSFGMVQPKRDLLTSSMALKSLQGKVSGVTITANAAPKMATGPKITMRGNRSPVADSAVAEVVVTGYAGKKSTIEKVPVRQNLNETAFFYPDLKTDSEGNVSFEFTTPEALTKWKFMVLAHTKEANFGLLEKEVVTQKEFSVTPNYPRFLREGDEINLQSKLSNLSSKKLKGVAQLQILDAFTNEDVTEKFGLSQITQVQGYNFDQSFELNENANSVAHWKLKVPKNASSVIFKVVAKAGNFSDGEQKAIPILPNRMLVTESVPVFVKEGETKTFTLDHLKNNTSSTLENVSNTLELNTNPVWEILFALPSLKEDANNSADVIFNKWFADVIASEVFKANPKMKTIFEEYQSKGLLTSNLEKNQELKQLLLEETPWVLESKNEEDQMKKLALLFDANSMRNSIQTDWADFKKLQNSDGGFSWYSGYPSSYTTSLYILKNLGKINSWIKSSVKDYQDEEQEELVEQLIDYVDKEIGNHFNGKADQVWNNWSLDYLDARRYWEKEYPLKGKGATLKSLVKEKAKTAKLTDFTFFGLHRMALLTNDFGLKEVSNKLLHHLKETTTETKSQGTYWKKNEDNWGWFNSKIVNHAGAIEAFSQLKPSEISLIEDLKIWLATQKEVSHWGNSRGTAEVIFTILNSGKSWTNSESNKAKIVWGTQEIQPQATGFVKSSIKTNQINKDLGSVTITKDGPGLVQGGLYWQYYEDLDKIKSSENYLSVMKELYKKIKTENGDQLEKITASTPLKVGDKVTVRMILNTDREMEFVHIKDMRAAGFEPIDVLSSYVWKNNLGYYQSTKDASTNFYIQYMPKGKYVFEYDFVANASGKFSNGITTIQNYYAPQMSSQTKGTTVEIKE